MIKIPMRNSKINRLNFFCASVLLLFFAHLVFFFTHLARKTSIFYLDLLNIMFAIAVVSLQMRPKSHRQ